MKINVKEIFGQACWNRANQIWWEARTALMPVDAINALTKTDKEFMKLMDEREEVLSQSFYTTVDLHQMSKEFHEKNTEEALKAACEDIKEVGKETVEKARTLSKKFSILEEEYQSRRKATDEEPTKKDKKSSKKLINP